MFENNAVHHELAHMDENQLVLVLIISSYLYQPRQHFYV